MRNALIAVAGLLVFAAMLPLSSAVAQQQPAPGVQVGVQAGAQGGVPVGRGRGRNAGPPRPAPRNKEGRVLLAGATPADKGVWLPGPVIPDPLGPSKELPFQPWARALFADRRTHQLEPHARCKPSGVARVFLTPYGVEITEFAELQRVYIFDIGGPHTFRTIYLDGRSHPKTVTPSYYGHSIGWWEGDTLAIDTVGFNEGFWLDRGGLPNTDQLHTSERLTRTSLTHPALRADRRRSGHVHQAVEGATGPDLGKQHRAVRVHVPGTELRARADGRTGDEGRPKQPDHSVSASQRFSRTRNDRVFSRHAQLALPLALAVAVFLAPRAPRALLAAPAGAAGGRQAQPAQGQNPQAQQAPAPTRPGRRSPAGAAQGRGRGQTIGGVGRGRAAGPPKPAPRLASGRVQLNEKGVWIGGGGVGGRGTDVPYQEWARAVAADRRVNELEPHTRCKASGFQRQFLTPYGAEITEIPELQRIYIFDIGGPHTFRTIYTDGRSHPKNLEPTLLRPLDRLVGRRHARRRHRRLQRGLLDRSRRCASHRQAAHGREVHAHRFQRHPLRPHRRRSRRLHEAVGRDDEPAAGGQHANCSSTSASSRITRTS